MAGEADKLQGQIKEGVGKLTGDRRLESEGKADQAKGALKDAAQAVKDGVKGAVDSARKG